MSGNSYQLDGRVWDLSHPALAPGASSVFAAVERARLRETIGASGLLGLAAVTCSRNAVQAITRLVNDFGFTRATAKTAVSLGARLAEGSSRREPVGYLAGVPISAAQS